MHLFDLICPNKPYINISEPVCYAVFIVLRTQIPPINAKHNNRSFPAISTPYSVFRTKPSLSIYGFRWTVCLPVGDRSLVDYNRHPESPLLHANCQTFIIRGETQKFPELLKKLFKIFVQVWNFSPLQRTPPVTGCSATSAALTAGNIVSSLLIQLTFKFGKGRMCSKRGHKHIIDSRYFI